MTDLDRIFNNRENNTAEIEQMAENDFSGQPTTPAEFFAVFPEATANDYLAEMMETLPCWRELNESELVIWKNRAIALIENSR